MSLLDKASLIVTPNSYKTSKLYSVIPNTTLGDMDVVRATTATRVNASGLIESVGLNIPRIDYINGSCPSLLVEPQRTNLLTYNNTFSDISWFKPNAVITLGTISSPDGLINSSILTDTVTNSSHVVQKTLTVSLGQSYSISIYAKKKDLNFLIIGTTGMGTGYSYFNINNGTIGNVLSTHTAKIINANNGWYKCVITGVTTSTVLNILYGITATNGTSDYVGTGLGNYIYGTQVELGSYDTSLIPTVASTVTRNADVISKTGISSLIGQTEGTLFCDFILKNPLSSTNRIISITKPLWSNGSIRLDITTSGFTADMTDSGASSAVITYSTSPMQNIRYKVAIAYKLNDFKMYINGIDAGSDTTTNAIPSCSELYLNALGGGFGATYDASNINSAQLYKTRLTNTELQSLTTL